MHYGKVLFQDYDLSGNEPCEADKARVGSIHGLATLLEASPEGGKHHR
jgi:hypothetical protein